MWTVELTTIQIILGLIGVIASLVGVLVAMTRWMSKQIDSLRAEQVAAREKEEAQLKAENERLNGEVEKLRFKLNESEAARQIDRTQLTTNQGEIAQMRDQMGTVLAEMAALQGQVKVLTEALDDKTVEAQRNAERARQLEKTLDQRDRELGDLQAQVRTYERVVAHFGEVYQQKQKAEPAPEAGERLTEPETGKESDHG